MNLREVIRSGYKIFSRMAPEKKSAHVLAIQYIELLASQTGTRMEPWDIQAVFGTGKGNELITDKNEINKKFFAQVELLKTQTPAEVFQIEARIATQIDALARTNAEREVRDLKNTRDRHIAAAQRNFDQANASLVEAHNIEKRLMSTERRESTVSMQFGRLLKESFWDFHSLNGGAVELVTRNDLIVTHKNPAAGLDLRVNFGRFRAKLNLDTMGLTVHEHQDNITAGSHIHPHIGSGGNICWGTAASTVGTKLPKGEIYDCFKLLESVLCNYNEGNPYVALQDYQGKAKHSAPPRPVPPPNAVEIPLPGMTPMPPRRDPGAYVGGVGGYSMGVDMGSVRGRDSINTVAVPPGHPRDSTEPALEGCNCAICTQSRVYAGTRMGDGPVLNPIVVDQDALRSVLESLRSANLGG